MPGILMTAAGTFARSAVDVAEGVVQRPLRLLIRNDEQLKRFRDMSTTYRVSVDGLYSEWGSPPAAGDSAYEWSTWAGQVRRAFDSGVPLSFLDTPVLRQTMVVGRRLGLRATAHRVPFIVKSFGVDAASTVLREDPVGSPNITDLRYRTSACRAWAAYGLAQYFSTTGRAFWDVETATEWGGGFGTMALLSKRMNPRLTYTVLDLPELSALQYVYLGSVLGKDAVRMATRANPIVPGMINLLPSSAVLDGSVPLQSEAFLSTWALTESGQAAQRHVAALNFFNARNVLLAYARNEDNVLIRDTAFTLRFKVPHAPALPADSDYAFS
jgi:hypothetical protein